MGRQPLALTWPISFSACPIPAPSPLVMLISIFASRYTTRMPPTTGVCFRPLPSTRASAGSTARPSPNFMAAWSISTLAPGFAAAAPVLGTNPVGALTGIRYPRSLIRSDRLGIEPRVGISWRPIPASTIVVRAGYGIYHDTSVYQTSALALAQQAPFSKSLNIQNSAACPLTLANPFSPCSSTTPDNFAVDPGLSGGLCANLAVIHPA